MPKPSVRPTSKTLSFMLYAPITQKNRMIV
jgi:hypothetical protein